jgi:hypothetical protein
VAGSLASSGFSYVPFSASGFWLESGKRAASVPDFCIFWFRLPLFSVLARRFVSLFSFDNVKINFAGLLNIQICTHTFFDIQPICQADILFCGCGSTRSNVYPDQMELIPPAR